jgi:hypothetical protein
VFCYTLWHFYAFSETNLLTRCHSASSLFSAIFVFQKSYTGNILGIRWDKSRISYISWKVAKSEDETEGGAGPGHTLGRRGPGPGHATRVRPPGPPPDAALPPIYSPRREKLKGLINFPQNILQAAAIVDVTSGGYRSSSRHPAREGNHRRRPSSSPWSPPEWCVSTLP